MPVFFNNWRTIFLLILFLSSFHILLAQDSLVINGTIDTALNGQTITLKAIYPYRTNLDNPILDQESLVKEGKFFFLTSMKNLELYSFAIKNKEATVAMFLEAKPTNIFFSDSTLKTYQLIGGAIDSEYEKISPFLSRRNYTEKEVSDVKLKYIRENIQSPIVTSVLMELVDILPDSTIRQTYSQIPKANKNNSWGRELDFIINNLMVGAKAPNFVQKDTAGVNFELATTRGKYVLVDFWASWCVPCRVESPYLIKAFKKYGKKNFDIVSVSIDKDQNKWLAAIYKDKVNIWHHTSDLKDWENEVSINYRIRSVPRNFLLDPKGIIVAKNLRGTELLNLLQYLKQ